MNYTEEDANSDYQMSIECPLCLVCGDSGFVAAMFADGIHDVPCENCNPPKVNQEEPGWCGVCDRKPCVCSE